MQLIQQRIVIQPGLNKVTHKMIKMQSTKSRQLLNLKQIPNLKQMPNLKQIDKTINNQLMISLLNKHLLQLKEAL